MTFAKRMKELAMKASEAAQDFAAKAEDAAQDLGTKSIVASKEFIDRAGDKVQDLGTKGKLLFEVKQLESKAEKLMEQLGAEVYNALAEQKIANISQATPGIKEIFVELDAVKKEIDKKEEKLAK
ncbi:MAG: hypothetical protein LBH75_01740 [Treponema sp.]|nr:hypothetical protein [Treponema sp.]